MPKKIDKEEKKSNILEASIKVFSKKGVAKAKISDIAEAAGIGKGTIYEYFRSKDEIFVESFHFFLEKVDGIISQRLYRISDPMEKLLAYSSTWTEIFEGDYLEYASILLDFWAKSIRNKKEAIALNLVKIYDENRNILKSLLEDCITKEKTSSLDVKVAASILIASLEGLFIQWILDRSAFDFKETAKLATKILIEWLKKRD